MLKNFISHVTTTYNVNIDKNELYACFCWFRWQPLGLVVIGVSLYLLLGKGDLLSAVFEMPYIQYFIIILIFCGCAIIVLAIFGLVANRIANFHFLVAVCRLSFAWVLEAWGDTVALLAGQRTCVSQVAGSRPGWAPLRSGLAQATYTCMPLSPSSIIWYRPRRVIYLAVKVTVGLAESNGSLPSNL